MKQLLIGGFGVVLVTAAVAVVLLIQYKPQSGAPYGLESAPSDAITFDEFLSGTFSARRYNGSWWSDTELQWKDKEGNLVTWDITTNQTTVLVSADLLNSFSENRAQFKGFSPDTSLLLFAVEVESVYRHSYTARYVTFNPENNITSPVGMSGEEEARLQYCAWVDNDDGINTLAIVYMNNLYWRPEAEAGWEKDLVLSTDGLADTVFNGIPDWVYEEEVLGTNNAHYFNEQGSRVAFAKFNDSLVPDFRYPHYGDPEDVDSWKYPEYRVVRYPKAGETNPTVSLHVRTFGDESNKLVLPPDEVKDWGEIIYTTAGWNSEDTLSVTWMNRIQNKSAISECKEEAETWQCKATFLETQEGGWLEIAPPPRYSAKRDSFLRILPSKQEDFDGRHYRHLALVQDQANVKFLTQGKMVIISILAWDEEADIVYMIGTDTDSPGSRHLYTASVNNPKGQTCVTCDIKTTRGELCLFNGVSLNFDNSHYVHTCGGLGIPEVVLRRTSDNSIVYALENNDALEERLADKVLPTRVDTFVDVEGGFRAPAKIMLPPHMDESMKYPVIVYVYGGPGFQMVHPTWAVDWEDYLVTSRNVVVISIDGRGSGYQSDEMRFQVYRNLGTAEIDDQREVTRKLIEMNTSLDPERVGIWGWSYGGFFTAMSLERDNGPNPVFSCGISVAPPTSWLLYDSIYTERYMSTPEDNHEGYNNSVISGIEGLRGKNWMLNHGVADDNVHFQHTMLLTKAMERADIQFTQHSYPDENHGLGHVTRFVYHAMDNFWEQCFKLE